VQQGCSELVLHNHQFGIIGKPLTVSEKLYNQGWLRKLFVLTVLAALWEGYASWLDNELLVPTFSATVRALIAGIVSGTHHRTGVHFDAGAAGWV
jgi:NitT/TauT family transport system permease protein